MKYTPVPNDTPKYCKCGVSRSIPVNGTFDTATKYKCYDCGLMQKDTPKETWEKSKIKPFIPLAFGFEKGLISHDGACYIKKDNIHFYGQNIDPKELDSKIKTLERLKLIKKEYELFFGKI
jgi:hypothetical protein